MVLEMDNLQVGTLGWQYESWVGGFYPDDMPEDWWLDYYANHYRVVLVPESQWMSWQEEAFEEVLEAVEGDFRFYFQLTEPLSPEKLEQLDQVQQNFDEKAAGVIYVTEQVDASVQKNKEVASMPVTLWSQTQRLPGWHWQYGDWHCSGAVCGVVGDINIEPKQQTVLLQEFMQSLPDGQEGVPLIVHSEQVDMKQLYSLKTIGEFLGY